MQHKKFTQQLTLLLSAFALLGCTLSATELNTLPDFNNPVIELSADESDIVIDYPKYITDRLLLPRRLYILQGITNYTDSFNIYYRNVLSTLSTTYNLSPYSSFGESVSGRWYAKTADPNMPFEPFNLNFVANVNGSIFSQALQVEMVSKLNQNPVRLLAIGDSLTRAGVYLSEVQTLLPNVSMLGTRFYPNDGLPAREGRGGWSLEDYFTFQNVQQLDSPFMFPVGISGDRYKGNTRDWRNICYENPKSAVYDGFQKIARGWKDEGDFLYDTRGYYKYPTIGDVMYNPDAPSYCQWIEWDGSIWVPMATPPTAFEFSFSKYMQRFSAAFTSGSPTHISILLGANEFGLNKQLDQMDTYLARLNQMIDSIHAYDPNIKVILCLPTLGPNTDRITSENNKIYTEYNLCMKYTVSKLLDAFDTDEALARQIYIAPMTLTVDPNNGFTYVQKQELVDGTMQTVTDVQNSIHPNNSYGQLQMGSTLAAVIQKTR